MLVAACPTTIAHSITTVRLHQSWTALPLRQKTAVLLSLQAMTTTSRPTSVKDGDAVLTLVLVLLDVLVSLI